MVRDQQSEVPLVGATVQLAPNAPTDAGSVIGAITDANGNFRVLVVQDTNDVPWPELIRAGGGVYGWAMLSKVPVWYELWRQFNAFPPNFMEEANKSNKAENDKTKNDK
jgi:hypothetical protein